MMTTAAIALGGNVGAVSDVFVQALAALDLLPEIQMIGRSRNFRTQPIGDNAGTVYVNAVALLQATCSAAELLSDLQRVENRFGRTRETHWGPRTLDLDLLSFGSEVIELGPAGEMWSGAAVHRPLQSSHGTLIVPHPACWYRRFVLDPWCDVAPHWRHPILGESVREMQSRLTERPLRVQVVDATPATRDALQSQISASCLPVDLVQTNEPSADVVIHLCFGDRGLVSDRRAECQRIIALEDSAKGIAMALTVLNAALDQPVPCSG